jgi:hypothetical protein
MANSFVRYTGNGSTTQYAVNFTYRDQADITVTINGVATTAFTYNASGTQITFNTAPASASAIEIRRTTSQTSRLVDYAAGSVLTENDLDTDSNQAFFMGQEAIDDANDVIKLSNTNFQWDGTSKRLTNIADPTSAQDVATKNYLENTFLTSANKTALTTVNANIANINSVNSNATNINSAVSNATNINLVAGSIGSVNTVATDIAKVIAVANDLAEAVSEVETVADDLNETTSEIDTVATNIANVNIVGGLNTQVTTLAGLNTEISALYGIRTAISGVNTISANVTAVNNNSANINTVAGLNTEIGNLGTTSAVSNIQTVATNIIGVNSFAERYRIASSAPGSSNDVGDLYFDTTANELKVYKASGWAAAGSTVNGTSNRFQYTATNNQTTFTGADSNSKTLAYDSPFVDVFLNGVKLANADFTATSGSSIVLASGASTGDILSVVAYGTFQLANISIKDLTDTPANFGTAGQALAMNQAGNAVEFQTIQASELSTVGNVFSNYNTVSANATITTSSTKNSFLKGLISVTGNAVLTIAGNGTLEFI